MSYADEGRAKKPVSMLAAIAVNGAVVTAVMLSPIVAERVIRDRPPIMIDPTLPTPPPEPVDQNHEKPRPIEPVTVPTPPFPLPSLPDPIPTTFDPPLNPPGLVDGTGSGDGIDLINKIKDPLPPIFRRAVRDPKFAAAFQPDYPTALLNKSVEGSATIRVLVGTDGRVREAQVVSATHPDFGKAAVRQALKAWRFKPATRGGEAVEDWVTLPVSFVIN
jgi:periplasmic protein TonB